MYLFDAISPAQAAALRAKALAMPFEDGARTSGIASAGVKVNKQLTGHSADAMPLLNEIRAHVMACKLLCVYALPRELVTLMVNQYNGQESYGWHTDNPYIQGKRTDVSFTLFLTDPNDYDGGELEIQQGPHTARFKGQAGQVVAYSTGDLHRVTPVTRGSRVSAVGWFTSWIALDADRDLLFRMQRELQQLAGQVGLQELEALTRVYQQLTKRLST